MPDLDRDARYYRWCQTVPYGSKAAALDQGQCVSAAQSDQGVAPARKPRIRHDGAGCTDEDGRTRSGQLIITYGSAWLSDSSNVSVEMIDYHINGVLHEGQISLLKKSNSSGDMEVVSNISGGKIHTANGIIQYESIKTTEWLAGATTVDTSDDILKTYGNANGVNREGVSYASVIVQPLYQELSCDYISAGVVDLSPAGKETRSTYFGDQTCDDKATVTIGNLSFEITLQ